MPSCYLIGPINEQDVHVAENPRITFRGDADVDLLGSDEFETQLFVSALRPGQGLWPDDKWPDRNPLFEDDPDTDDLDDFNPNRIFTSKRLTPGEYFYDITLHHGKYVLTAGIQTDPQGSPLTELHFRPRFSDATPPATDTFC